MNSFEQNKKDLLEALKGFHKPENKEKSSEVKVVIYNVESPFISNLLDRLKKHYSLSAFKSHEAAIAHCLDNPVDLVILDMDTPTDWKMSTDIFTNVRTMKPDAKFLLVTASPQSIPVLTLAAQSADVLKKPFVFEALASAIKAAASA